MDFTHFDQTEALLAAGVRWLRLIVESMGALVIGLGVILAITAFVTAVARRQTESYNGVRLTLARYLAVALEFQLAADILSTAIAPSWDQIGKLGAIAVIRTALNFFLTKEMEAEALRIRAAGNAGAAAAPARIIE